MNTEEAAYLHSILDYGEERVLMMNMAGEVTAILWMGDGEGE